VTVGKGWHFWRFGQKQEASCPEHIMTAASHV
jgi:hypothetical protein